MDSLEQAERIGGAAFVGVPAFEAFVSILDTYARMELLVRLHDSLPPFLVNPVTSFVCMCIGLWLIHLSNQQQLKLISTSRLLDSSGAEYQRNEKPKWLIPVLVSFLAALVLTPLLAVGYSLAYKGTPPKMPPVPNPPYWVYERTPAKPEGESENQQKAMSQVNQGGSNNTNTQIGIAQAPVAIAPYGIANAAPNRGQQTVNILGPPPVQLTWDSRDVVPSTTDVLGPQDDKVHRYEKEVTVRVSATYSPVSIAVLCDSRLANVNAYPHGNSVTMTNVNLFINRADDHVALVYFGGSPITPSAPLVVHLWADQPFSVRDVRQAKIAGLSD